MFLARGDDDHRGTGLPFSVGPMLMTFILPPDLLLEHGVVLDDLVPARHLAVAAELEAEEFFGRRDGRLREQARGKEHRNGQERSGAGDTHGRTKPPKIGVEECCGEAMLTRAQLLSALGAVSRPHCIYPEGCTSHMRFLSSRDIEGLLPAAALIDAVEQALRDFAAGQVVVPPRLHVHHGEVTILTMPVAGRHTFGAKLVSVVPSNAQRGLPVTQGLMTLCDGATGTPLAVLNAAMLTARRTGAVGALALKYTTPPALESIGVIGAGVQGTWLAISACAVRPVQTIHFVARSESRAEQFAETLSRHVPEVRLLRCTSAEELLGNSQAVFAATTSSQPVFANDARLLEGKHFFSIGSYKPNMQELPDAVYALSRTVVVDSGAARDEVGDLIGPLATGLIRSEDIVHLADLVAGTSTVQTDGTTVFKSVGLALYDLYAAQALVAEAERLGRGQKLDL